VLHNNKLEGNIPSLNYFPQLQNLVLRNSKLEGNIPPLNHLTQLQFFYLRDNKLSGPLPNIDNLHQLNSIQISNNKLNGPLPTNFSNFPDLVVFLAHNNDFDSELSNTIFDLQHLEIAILSGNKNLKGTLPTTISSSALVGFVAEGCSLSGDLPQKITSNLTSLYLAGNDFSSTTPSLPPTIRDVSFANNRLHGSLNDNFFNDLKYLNSFDARNNRIGGTMPTSIGKLSELTDLKLDLNTMSGDLPSDIMSWPIFMTNNTNTSILTGNVWGCPVPDGMRDHSNDDPTHTYLCGDDAFMIPLLLFGAAYVLFYFASNNASTNPELQRS